MLKQLVVQLLNQRGCRYICSCLRPPSNRPSSQGPFKSRVGPGSRVPVVTLPSSSVAAMSTSTSSSSSQSLKIVVHSVCAEGPRGIRKSLEDLYPEVNKQCTFIPFDVPLSDDSLEAFRTAEVILMDTERLPSLMNVVKNVKWVQSTWAGVDSFIDKVDEALLPPQFTLTRFAGVFGPHMAEYVIGHILARERHLRFLWEAQQRKEWALEEYTSMGYQLLRGKTISVIGAGDIGTEIGRVCKAFNMRVIGLVRKDVPKDQRSSSFDEYSQDLPYVLAEANFIVSVLPNTALTIGLLSGDALSHCKKKPMFINVGRGNVISEASIVRAIRDSWISHAVLDVTDPEPLPKESPLWTMPEVTITPHVSAQSHGPEIVEVFMENYRRYVSGQPLRNQLDWSAKY